MSQIERVQYEAALAVSGDWQGSNMDKLHEEVGWESLSRRRWSRRLVQLFQILNDPSTPDYLKSLIPSPIDNSGLHVVEVKFMPSKRKEIILRVVFIQMQLILGIS